MSTYKPLPKSVTIQESTVDGLGLFSTQFIKMGTVLGTSHIRDSRFENGFIRTPLGGFVNHSEEPNCHFVLVKGDFPIAKEGELMQLIVIKDIEKGEELFSKYWLYKI